MASTNIQLTKISNELYKENKDKLQDIILFGSSVRGKSTPSDIDILLIFKEEVDKDIEYKFRKSAEKICTNISLTSKTQKNMFDESFLAKEGILFEGYSFIQKKYIASSYGFEALGLFIYQTQKLDNTNKTRFYYALNGRKRAKGVTEFLDAIKLSNNILAVPLVKIEQAKEFFDEWKIEYLYVPSLLPSRLAKKQIIGKVI